eukprot:10289420-Alexandrium_andersonii.AAC.1
MPWPSSTRAEMYAVLVAMRSPRPILLGLGNKNAVAGVRRLLRGLSPKRPWGLCRDGDLWAKLEAALGARGRHSFGVAKLKGHC